MEQQQQDQQFVPFPEATQQELHTKRNIQVQDRQWDARFNSPNEDFDHDVISAAQGGIDNGRLRYVLVGGPEIGTQPTHSDFATRHIHVALVFHNPTTRNAILKMFNVKKGFYLQPRNRALPIGGWRDHHIKVDTKIDPNILCLFEAGELPADTKKVYTLRSAEEKRHKNDEVLRLIYDHVKIGTPEDEIFKLYPRNWTMYGEKIKSMVVQRSDFFKQNGDPHIWLHGTAGEGKSSLIAYIYPKVYKKNLYNRFFDLYKPTEHTHVVLEDLDHAACETLSLNFIKTLCDESGFTYDQKYKAAQPARTTVVVTSQFTISSIVAHLDKQIEIAEQAKALHRRFWEVKSSELQRLLGIKLRNNYELSQLKREGNTNPGACFQAWNYPEDMPSVKNLPTPEECQQIIKNAYYG